MDELVAQRRHGVNAAAVLILEVAVAVAFGNARQFGGSLIEAHSFGQLHERATIEEVAPLADGGPSHPDVDALALASG